MAQQEILIHDMTLKYWNFMAQHLTFGIPHTCNALHLSTVVT